MKHRISILVPLVALLLLTAGGHISAQEGPSIWVDPVAQNVGPEDGAFEVRILVHDVTSDQGLGGYTLVMTYDQSIVHARTITDSGFVASTDNPVICPASAIDNDDGRLAHFCLTIPIIPQPGPQTSEPQVLARVTFEPVGEGITALDISETTIIDPEGNELAASTSNGQVTIGSGDPSPTSTAEADSETDGGTNVALYIGFSVAGLLAVVLLGAGLAFWRRRWAIRS